MEPFFLGHSGLAFRVPPRGPQAEFRADERIPRKPGPEMKASLILSPTETRSPKPLDPNPGLRIRKHPFPVISLPIPDQTGCPRAWALLCHAASPAQISRLGGAWPQNVGQCALGSVAPETVDLPKGGIACKENITPGPSGTRGVGKGSGREILILWRHWRRVCYNFGKCCLPPAGIVWDGRFKMALSAPGSCPRLGLARPGFRKTPRLTRLKKWKSISGLTHSQCQT